jgi:hypothetical protein
MPPGIAQVDPQRSALSVRLCFFLRRAIHVPHHQAIQYSSLVTASEEGWEFEGEKAQGKRQTMRYEEVVSAVATGSASLSLSS